MKAWTVESILIVILGILVSEGMSIMNRSQKGAFSWTVYRSNIVNWISMLVSFGAALLLLVSQDGVVDFMGLEVKNPEQFGPFYAVLCGLMGQGLLKKLSGAVDKRFG